MPERQIAAELPSMASTSGSLSLSAEMTSPYSFYQYWMNVEDASVGHLLRVYTDRPPDEIESLER